MIYLDNAATTKIDKRVLAEMLPFLTEYYGNPESPHVAGRMPAQAVKIAEERVRRMLGVGQRGTLIFTSGGTESNNMVFAGMHMRHKTVIVSSASEHKSVLKPAAYALPTYRVTLIPGKKGYISVLDFNVEGRGRIATDDKEQSSLVSIMYVNNETGTKNEVEYIGNEIYKEIQRGCDIYYHIDCVQAAGCVPITGDPRRLHADFLSVSSHKIHGPKGVGCLWVSDRVLNTSYALRLPLIVGGGQQKDLRAGTLNVPGIVGFGKAAEIVCDSIFDDMRHFSEMYDAFVHTIHEKCKENDVKFVINYDEERHRTNKIVSVSFPGADAETVVLIASDRYGLCVSNGAACNAYLSEPSYVLLSCGLDETMARNTIRVSFSRDNTIEECVEGAKRLVDAVKEVLSLSNNLDPVVE